MRSGLHDNRLRFAQFGFALDLGLHAFDRTAPLVKLAKDHFSGSGLQDGCHRDVHVLADQLARIVHHHHGAVVEIGDALVVLLAFFQDEDAHGLAGKHDGLEGVGQFVDVEHFHALELGDFVEVEIVGDDLAFIHLRQFDQFEVDCADGGKIVFDDLHVDGDDLLHALQHVKTAASTITFERVGGVRDQLQLAQHELRNDQDAIEEAGVGNVRNAAVNDDAGIEDLEALAALLFRAENPAERRQVQQVAFVGADDQANVRHQQHDHELQKTLAAFVWNAVLDDNAEQISAENAENASDHRADQPFEADNAQPHLKDDDRRADCDSHHSGWNFFQSEGLQ